MDFISIINDESIRLSLFLFQPWWISLHENIPFDHLANIAAQIAYYLKDDQHTVGYLKRAFELGLPFSALKAAPIFSNIEKSAVYPHIVAAYQSCQKPKFDTATRDEIYQRCFESDSIKFYKGRDPQKIKAFHDSENEFR